MKEPGTLSAETAPLPLAGMRVIDMATVGP